MKRSTLTSILYQIKSREDVMSIFLGCIALGAVGYAIFSQFLKFKSGLIEVHQTTTQSAGDTTTTPSGRVHITEASDTLWNIAQKYYGDGNKWVLIYEQNKEKIHNPEAMVAGVELEIPIE